MFHTDGTMLARFPPKGAPIHLDVRSGFHRVIAADAEGGFYTSTAETDHIERRLWDDVLDSLPERWCDPAAQGIRAANAAEFVMHTGLRAQTMRG